jgi:hypothetical protein
VTLLRRLASIVRWLLHRNRAGQDLNDELQTFVDMAAADRMRDGTAPADAGRTAVIDLAGVEQTKERVRSFRHGDESQMLSACGWFNAGEAPARRWRDDPSLMQFLRSL